jgi:DNA-binding response OmpR family regulator
VGWPPPSQLLPGELGLMAQASSEGPVRILVVEDSPESAHLIQAALRANGYEVAGCVASAKAAVTMALSTRPDLVLMDIVLEGVLDGIEAARIILEDTGCPVVFLTGHTSEDLIKRAGSLKPHGYLVKPLNPRALRPAIELALERARLEREERGR